MSAAPYRSTVAGRSGFGQTLLAEWTKLRSVPRWLLTLLAAIALTVLVALMAASGTSTDDVGPGTLPPGRSDAGALVYRPLAGDGALVARVARQAGSHPRAKAGLILRESLEPGARYAAVAVTPREGIRLLADFETDEHGGEGAAPQWLRLERSGSTVRAFASADGQGWSPVGTVDLPGLPREVVVGLLVASPGDVRVERRFGGETVDEVGTIGEASFDGIRFEPAEPQDAPWQRLDRELDQPPGAVDASGTVTLRGSGDVGPDLYGDDHTRLTLSGAMVGLVAIVALGVLFIASEYRTGLIRTTLAATPRRGRVLAAKAVVLAAAAFAAGLVAALASFLLGRPLLDLPGSAPSLTDGDVIRAIAGTGAMLALVAVLALGVAAAVRRTAPAIALVLLLLLVPHVLATGLPLDAATWLQRLTPSAGFEIQQTVRQYDTPIGPWGGLAVLAAYAAASLLLGAWRLRRQDA